MDFVNFKKQKEKLYFYTERPEIYCVVDLKKGTVYESITDRTRYDFTVLQKYIHVDHSFDDWINSPKDLLSQLKAVILFRHTLWSRRSESILGSLRRLESAISVCYENNLECYLNGQIESHIPVGFVNWLKEKREIFSYSNMNKFIIDKLIRENFSTEWYPYIGLVLKELVYMDIKVPIIFLKTECGKTYLKIVKKTLLGGFYNYNNIIPDYDAFEFLVNNPEEGLKLLDTNRDIQRNLRIVREYLDKKEQETFIKRLTKINFVNQFTKGNYIVVVPQTLEDLIDEGKQQNNCVGSFYNDDIFCGRDYIYFIRRKDNPNKSVATARYHVEKKKTVELREKNNKEAHEQFWTFAKEIDELINNYLK